MVETTSHAQSEDLVLAVEGASKRFGTVEALRGLDLHLRRGEWLGLLGPNGAGKTTLVRAIAGRVALDAGSVALLGRPISAGTRRNDARDRLGVVPQEIALYPPLTARENLRAFGTLHGLRGSELAQRVEWALGWTGLGERAEERCDTFSGGMKRRLNIAAGVLHRPEVLLLDEPTVGVDPQSRQRIWEMLEELRASGTSLLLTTHQLDEAQTVCERIAIVDHGQTIAEGTLDELIVRTVGRARRVVLSLERALPLGDPRAALTEEHDCEIEAEGLRITFQADDVAARLAAVLEAVRRAGGSVHDVRVEAPSLQAVFLHLTGRELRE